MGKFEDMAKAHEARRQDRNRRLKALIEEAKKDIYLEEYRETKTDEDTLGCMVSQYFSWSGNSVVKTAISALEDSNIHPLARMLSGFAA